MSTDRFHKAAKDGLADILKEATRRDCNSRDEGGMTPTLWAAFEGNLDALRILVARGGDPDKADHWGNTALHLCAARGHANCASFLLNFGANPHAIDVDGHTPQQLAAINGREQLLRLLDSAIATLDASDKKKAKLMREKAKKDSEKRIKEYNKRQIKAEHEAEKQMKKMAKEQVETVHSSAPKIMPHRPSTVLISLKQKMQRAGSMGNLASTEGGPQSYSALVGTMAGTRGASGVQRKLLIKNPSLSSRFTNNHNRNNNGDFKISAIEDGKKSVRSLTGVRKDSEILFVINDKKQIPSETVEDDDEDEIPLPGRLSRTLSQPDFLTTNNDTMLLHEPASILDRPGFGSIAFRKSITMTLNGMPSGLGADTGPNTGGSLPGEECSIGSAGSLAARQHQRRPHHKRRTLWDPDLSDSDIAGGDTSDDEGSGDEINGNSGSLERFLAAWGLTDYRDKFATAKVDDLDTLMLLTEDDLRQLGLPLGPHRKLATAVAERRAALYGPAPSVVTDSRL